MTKPEAEPTQFSTMAGVFCLLLMAVFAAEVLVMQYYRNVFARIPVVQDALIDATLLLCVIALPLWFFVFRPAVRGKVKPGFYFFKNVIPLYFLVLAVLFLIEFSLMLCLPWFGIDTTTELAGVYDGALTVLFSAPLFWWLLYRLEVHLRFEPLADFVSAPGTLVVLLLFMIFLADLLQEIAFTHFQFHLTDVQYQLLDGFVTLVLISPLLYILVVRPLRRHALSESARTNLIYDQVADAIIKVNLRGIIESFNSSAEKIFGIPAQVVIGKSAAELLDSNEFELTSELMRIADEKIDQPLEFYDLKSKRQDGVPLVLDLSVSQVKRDGPVEYLLLFHDITQRKATEEALLASNNIFREIFDQTEDAILFFKTGTGEVLDLNATTEKLYGFSKQEILTSGIQLFCDEEPFQQFTRAIAEVDLSGEIEVETLRHHKCDGSEMTISLRAKKIILRGEFVIYVTLRDISERVRLEAETRELQAKLIQTNKMTSLGLLVSGIAHEINNPNNYVLANAQLLGKVWNDAQYILQQYYRETGDFYLGGFPFNELETQVPLLFKGLTDGSQKIKAIVNDLKRFVREDRALVLTDIEINDVVLSAVSMLHYELAKYTDNFQLDLARHLPLVKGSSQQLGQVVINLLMNSCQALPDRSCSVAISTSLDPDSGQILIRVHDQGCGLSDELKGKILEPFFSTKLDSGGTGLGLSISQSIIKDHGGQLEFFSSFDSGTTFTVKLPSTL
ncbi:PAS domain-containing sensor histidine kinase [Geopsychrobacter electrodiphilus]|uniref:PAS domain-containing sensor histidine kinase n=1 Tax=Geopsychrobacter electrodiphilus TaxID=225196 RepID=UPI000382AA04|nr:PAS domain S-box protein [Geopsychrobacter electrodiphilus]